MENTTYLNPDELTAHVLVTVTKSELQRVESTEKEEMETRRDVDREVDVDALFSQIDAYLLSITARLDLVDGSKPGEEAIDPREGSWRCSCLLRTLRTKTGAENLDLPALEEALAETAAETKLGDTSPLYDAERQWRRALEKRAAEIAAERKPPYTPPSRWVDLADIFEATPAESPIDKLRQLLLKQDCRRTKLCIDRLITSAKDDQIACAYLRTLLDKIKEISSRNEERFILRGMTQFYFEIVLTHRHLLGDLLYTAYVTDLEDWFYCFTGKSPERELVERYKAKLRLLQLGDSFDSASVGKQGYPCANSVVNPAPRQDVVMDKADRFLQEANKLGFSQLPKIVELHSPEKVKQLVEQMLECPAHAAAMLEFLGFYKWIREKKIPGYTQARFIQWCTKYIMEKEQGNAFKPYWLSVSMNQRDENKSAYRYKAWKYRQLVRTEYEQIVSNIQCSPE